MSQRYRYLLKNIGILTISNFASKILVFLMVPLYTIVLTTEEYGVYDLIVSTVQLLFPILTLNIVDAVMRFSMDNAYTNNEIASIGIKYITRSFWGVTFFFLLCYNFQLIDSIYGLELLICFYYFSYVLNQFFIQFAKGLERVNDMAFAGVCSTIVMLFGNIIFLLLLKQGLKGFLIANILSQIVPAGYYFIKLRFWKYICKVNRSNKLRKEMLAYCTPLIFTAVGWWVNSASDKYIVTLMCGISANGILSVAYKIPSIINIIQGIFIQAWQISAIKEYNVRGTKKFYGDLFVTLNLVMSIACTILIYLSKPLASLIYSNDFYVAWKYVPFLLISSVLNAASGFIGPILSAAKDSGSMAKAAIYGAVINIVMNIILVYLIGVQGATIATVIGSYVIYAVRKSAVREMLVVESYERVLLTWAILVVQATLEVYTKFWQGKWMCILMIAVINLPTLKKLVKR